jgi:hypothetical protein
MSEQIFNTILDQPTESGVLRRSLETRSAAGGKNAKTAKTKGKKKKGRRCRAQVADCQDSMILACSAREDFEACQQLSFPCCDPLATCDATSMLECLFSSSL